MSKGIVPDAEGSGPTALGGAVRAWPFEGKAEAGGHLRRPSDFVAASGEGIEAVVVRIGLHDAQLVLVDGEGRWQRWVYRSAEAAKDAADSLGIPVHVGEYPEEIRVRMGSYRRPPEDFDRAPYPEQGHVGPVLSYPENRPRRAATKKDSRARSE